MVTAETCRWGGCGAPAVYEFRRTHRAHGPVAAGLRDIEFYCEDCAYLARQSYSAHEGGRWPDPAVPSSANNLSLTIYDWLERIEVSRIEPWPIESEQATAIEVGMLSLTRPTAKESK